MAIYKQINFDRVYAGNIPDSQHLVNWFASYGSISSTTSANSIAYGLYSADAFNECKQIGNIATTLSRYPDDNTKPRFDFKRVHRNSNFLIPVILGTINEGAVTVAQGNPAESGGDTALYSITINNLSNNRVDSLSNFNLVHEVSQLFLLHSFIITEISNTGFSAFSIFNNGYKDKLLQYYQPDDNSSKTLNVLFTQDTETNSPIKKFTSFNGLQFFEYNIPYGENLAENNITPTLIEQNDINIANLITKAQAGTLYISKDSLIDNLEHISIQHPTNVIGQLILNYHNSKKIALEAQEVSISGYTTNVLDFNKFNNNILKYKFKTGNVGRNSLRADDYEQYFSANTTASPYYYAGGILMGWTTNAALSYNNENRIIIYQEEELTNLNFYQAGSIVEPKNFYPSSCYNNDNELYFYFSNSKEPDLSSLTTNFAPLEINLYPIYKEDVNYIPPVIEVTQQINPNQIDSDEQYVLLTSSALQTFTSLAKYPKISGEELNSEDEEKFDSETGLPKVPYISIATKNTIDQSGEPIETTTFLKVGSTIQFNPEEEEQEPQEGNYFTVQIDGGEPQTVNVVPPTLSQILGTDAGDSNYSNPSEAVLGQQGWTNQLITPLEFGKMIDKNNTPDDDTDDEFNRYVIIRNSDGDGIKQGDNGPNGFGDGSYSGSYVGDDENASIYTAGGIYAEKNIIATRVFNAVFNDYAECRSTINLTPGHVVIDQDNGSLACTSMRLQPGAQIISDTYGHLMGATETATTPIAVAGRALVYTYQPRENYHAGMAVCSAPNGTIDIMTREEIKNYPDCIIGIVSEIPQYDVWGSSNVKVDGRIWIKVK